MLVFAAQGGDADAFAELFRRHYQTVRRACARRLRDIREADEVAQAAFVRAYERLDRCTGDRRFGAWVQVIANNLCVDHMRATTRTAPSDDVASESVDLMENGPENALLRAEQAAMIQRALASLPDRQRDVVVARDVDGRRPPEIAAALGLSLGAVDSLLLRARRRLAASVQAMSAESGTANLATTAAITAVGGSAPHFSAIARFAEAISEAIASASYQIAANIGMVPGMPSLVSQAAPAAAAGALALAPFGVDAPAPAVAPPVLPPITATVPAMPAAPAAPAAPSAQPLATVAANDPAPALATPTAPAIEAPQTDRGTPGLPPAAPSETPEVTRTVVSGLVDLATQPLR